ncbi:MAG: type II secretion system protein N [Pseudomonadota bacterium]
MNSIAVTPRSFDGSRFSAPFWIVALVAVLGAWRLWSFIDATRKSQPVAMVPPVQHIVKRGVDIAAIQSAHLFGASATTDTANVPVTTDMLLVGTFSTDDPQQGYAMVGASKGVFGVFQPGEEVVAGVRLQSIYLDYVLLERGGVVSRLDMSERHPDGVSQLLQADASVPDASSSISPARAPGPVEPEEVFQLQIARSNGKVQGYRVRPGSQPAAFQRAGLQAGDVVVAVNGQRDDVMRVLRSERSARLTILRDGAEQELTLNLDGPT